MDSPRAIDKPWGIEMCFANNQEANYCGKILTIKRRHRTSLHCHPRKVETFFVLIGTILLETSTHPDGINLQKREMQPGEAFEVPAGMWHRMTGLYVENRVIEASTFHEDSDVIRLVDGGPAP